MATNNFLEFNVNKKNIQTDAEYSAEAQRLGGVSGIANSKVHNKLFRQFSVMAAAIGEFIKGTGYDATDADVSALTTAISNSFASKTAMNQRNTFETAGGTGTAITLSTAVLTDKYSTTFLAAANNSGAATTINTKPLYKPGTTSTPTLIAGKAYTIWYSESGGCFFIKASAEGDAIVGNVLAGKVFSNDDTIGLTGSMPNNGPASAESINLTSEGAEYTIPAGYHSGLRKIKAVISGLIASVVKAGTTVGGIVGTFTADATATASQMLTGATAYVNGNKVTGTIISKSAASYNPSTTAQTIAAAQYLSGVQTINPVTGTATAADVLSGKTFSSASGINLTGTGQAGKRFASGTATSSASQENYTRVDGTGTLWFSLVVNGLAFKPSLIIAYCYWDTPTTEYMSTYTEFGYLYPKTVKLSGFKAGDVADTSRNIKGDVAPAYINTTGFKIPVHLDSRLYSWYAFE